MVRLTKKELDDLDLRIFLTPDEIYQVDSFLVYPDDSKKIQTIKDATSISDLFFMCHQLCHTSKNLYNTSLFYWRQQFRENRTTLRYETLDKRLKNTQEYRSLPAKVSQQTLKMFSQNIASYFGLKQSKKISIEERKKFNLPKYYPSNKFKPDGLAVVTFTRQAISKKSFKNGKVLLSGTGLEIDLTQFKLIGKLIQQNSFRFEDMRQIRIIPHAKHFNHNRYFKIEVVYAKPILHKNDTVRQLKYTDEDSELLEGDFSDFAAIDANVNDLSVVTRNQAFLFNLKPIKHINQKWNKRIAKLRSFLDCAKNELKEKEKEVNEEEIKLNIKKLKNLIKKATTKRNRRIETFIHRLTRQLITQLYQLEVKNLIWGKNKNIKKEINLGDKNNQNFVQIPFSQIIEKSIYKAHLVGINVFLVEESYTSKTSFLDKEFLHSYKTKSKVAKNHTFLGKRKSRGLFLCQDGTHIHADRNGALNIARKVMGQDIYNYVDLPSVKGSCPIRINIKQN